MIDTHNKPLTANELRSRFWGLGDARTENYNEFTTDYIQEMWEVEFVEVKNKEICYECGRSVKGGSGRFANRIPSFDDYETRKEMGVAFPEGEYLCAKCDHEAQKGNEEYFDQFQNGGDIQ